MLIRRVQGHSMVPVLPPGTLVIAWRTRKYKEGDIVIFLHEGKEKIKRISEMNRYEVFLTGDHAEASTDSRQFGWLPKTVIMGRVVWPREPATAT